MGKDKIGAANATAHFQPKSNLWVQFQGKKAVKNDKY